MIILHERHSPTLLPHLRVYVCGWTVKYALRNVHKDNRVYILGIIADFLRTWFDLTFCYAIFPYKIKMGDCAQPCAPSTNLPSAPSTNLPSIPSTQPQHPAMEFGLGDSMPAPAPSEGVWFGGTPCRLGDSMPFGGTPCCLGDSMPAPGTPHHCTTHGSTPHHCTTHGSPPQGISFFFFFFFWWGSKFFNHAPHLLSLRCSLRFSRWGA